MPLVPLRANNAYIGLGLQSAQGTAIAPSLFPRWDDGTALEYDLTFEDVWEGDTTRHKSLKVKAGQKVKVKLSFIPRPNELGFVEAAAQGATSDALGAATVNTSLSNPALAGASTFQVPSNAGLTGGGTASLVIGPGLTSEEIPIITTPVTGTGPYTATVNAAYNGGKLAKGHSASDVVRSNTTHTITDKSDGNYYSIEMNFGGAAGITIRIRDCKVDQIKRSAKAGSPLLKVEVDFIGCVSSVQGSPSTVTLEAHNPFTFIGSSWTLDGASTGDAPYLESFEMTQKNNADWVQTEQLTGDAIIFGAEDITGQFEPVWQNGSRIQQTYFGGTTGTTDSTLIGSGSLDVLFAQPDGFHSVEYTLPFIVYTKAEPPSPKADGKHFVQQIEYEATSNQGANATLLTSTIKAVQSTVFG